MEQSSLEPTQRRIPCPFCREPIIEGAIKCRHCGSDVTPKALAYGFMAERYAAPERNEGSSFFKRLGITVGVLIAIFFLFALIGELGSNSQTPRLAGGEIPTCGSAAAIDMLKGAVADSPQGKMEGVSLLDVEQVAEQSWSQTKHERHCSALALMNSGKHDISYTLSLGGQRGDTLFIQATWL